MQVFSEGRSRDGQKMHPKIASWKIPISFRIQKIAKGRCEAGTTIIVRDVTTEECLGQEGGGKIVQVFSEGRSRDGQKMHPKIASWKIPISFRIQKIAKGRCEAGLVWVYYESALQKKITRNSLVDDTILQNTLCRLKKALRLPSSVRPWYRIDDRC